MDGIVSEGRKSCQPSRAENRRQNFWLSRVRLLKIVVYCTGHSRSAQVANHFTERYYHL